MKTQVELIEHYTQQLKKVISGHGLGSGHFYMATFRLKAIQMGMNIPDMLKWSRKKMDELHEETLNFTVVKEPFPSKNCDEACYYHCTKAESHYT